MFSVASRTSFTVAVLSAATAFAAVLVTHDRVMFSALMFAAVVATIGGVAIFLYTPNEPVVPMSPDVEAATARTVDVTDLPRPSIWPLVAAASVALLAVAAALGRSLALYGLVIAMVAGLGWLAQVWREHPSWTAAMSARINDRFVVPIALPLTLIVVVGAAVVSLSRLLLASSVNGAPIIASVAAFAVLGAFTLLASRPALGRPALVAAVVASACLVVAAGVVGAMQGEREFHHKGEGTAHGEGGVELSADDLEFSTTDLALPADTLVEVAFVNEDSAPHNLAIYETKGGDELFKGDIINGGDEAAYEVGPLEAGSYYFQCDVHPQMSGTVEVAAAEPPAAGASTTSTSTGH